MKAIYNEILNAKSNNKKLLAILIDPEKTSVTDLHTLIKKIKDSPATHIFIGGSTYNGNHIDKLIDTLKLYIKLPILLFPGNPNQISNNADAILFLSLISGRNPDYLIDYQVQAVPFLKQTSLEIISTGYILIDGKNTTAVQRVSKTKPLARNEIQLAINTALAGEYLGNKLIYLEAGSGAKESVPLDMIKKVSKEISIPLIVGGGIRSQDKINQIYNAGADMVVIGTAFENNNNFFKND